MPKVQIKLAVQNKQNIFLKKIKPKALKFIMSYNSCKITFFVACLTILLIVLNFDKQFSNEKVISKMLNQTLQQ